MELPKDFNPDLYDPFDRLIEIEFLGKKVMVPENQVVLRCFQFLSVQTISYGRFCWNNDCGNCECTVVLPGETEPRLMRMCQLKVREGLKVVGTSRHVKLRI